MKPLCLKILKVTCIKIGHLQKEYTQTETAKDLNESNQIKAFYRGGVG